jgi:hypothetical protein
MAKDKYAGFRAFSVLFRVLFVFIIALLIFVPLFGRNLVGGLGGVGHGMLLWFFGLAVAVFIRLAAMMIVLVMDIAVSASRSADAAESLNQYMSRSNALGAETGRTAKATEQTTHSIESTRSDPRL